MVLHTTPYSGACLHFLDGLSWSLVFPCYWLLDQLLASCVATSLEKRRRSQDPCSFRTLCAVISAPLYLLLFLASLPLALLGFVLWAPLQAVRQPYLYSHRRPDKHQAEQGQAGPGGVGLGDWRPQGRSFCFCSANVCLLPDSLARFNNLSDTHRRAREVGKRIRNGASRPQIKIYIDSPTNTSISAVSFSSLATGFRRTSSLDQRPDQTHTTNGPAEPEPVAECPIHTAGAADCPVHPSAGDQGPECPVHPSAGDQGPECPLHPDAAADCPLHPVGTGGSSDCPVHASGEAPDCPLHSTGAQDGHGLHDCPVHGEGTQTKPSSDCPLHASRVQISISAPEPDPQEEEAETGNHRPVEAGDTGSMTASRESLARYHGGDGGVGVASNNTLSHVPRTSVFKRPGRKRRHGDETFDHDISAFFPANLDFLALQEVFDHGSTTRLRRQLHRYFPYVLSDVGRYGWKGCCSSFKFLNSGLMLASRYPILDARFECYPNGRREDVLAAKGALFAKGAALVV
ncbi:sphingomyelin phosphodiesterase 3 [Pseudoliparis swirei]|uniref:sphingomyelin phosphodiesterase 3 n=1 Tax=Pseudoliparis swirei TaxID=2059687 RepID=UPI0024BE6981|nr:sphingomyelin phosphodiesterase 3 [Pseudoliparis swirei]XP_056271906.1 sphingomyelin phosphodiesterase 3 [Pseudoliparis swirei]